MKNTASVAAAKHDGPILEKVDGCEVVDCSDCCYAHIRPMPSVENLKRLYTEKFYGEDKADYLVRMEQDLAWWNMVYSERLDTIERLLGTRGERRILDVGCSGGFFLMTARARDWHVQGIELGRQAAEYAAKKGIPVIHGDVQETDWKSLGAFDAIYMSFVFEHLPNPADILGKLQATLKPGGILCAEVPNDFNPLQAVVRQALGAKPYWVAPDHHLNYFTPESFRRLLGRTGFECAEMEGTFPMEFFLLMGDNYIGNDPAGRVLHGKRKQLETLLHQNGLAEFKRELYRFMIHKQIGREIVLYARNPHH